MDQLGQVSDWSELEVTMPRNILLHNTLFLWLLERFPNIFSIVKKDIRLLINI